MRAVPISSLATRGNSFTDTVTSGSGGGANVVSFPSIYIGGNGQIGGGTFNTWSDSGLPKQISAMKSVQTSFKWSGGTSGGNYNAAYDVWFAKSPPTAGGYNDAVSGFIMSGSTSQGLPNPSAVLEALARRALPVIPGPCGEDHGLAPRLGQMGTAGRLFPTSPMTRL